MMFWYNHGVSGLGWFAMSASMIIFWALVIGAGVLLFRTLGRPAQGNVERRPASSRPSPEQLLAERFARGEIDEEEYQRRLATLHATSAHRT